MPYKPPATAERSANGDVILTLERQRGAFEVLSPAQARQLAAELLVCADDRASEVAGAIGDGIDVFTQGVDLLTKVRSLTKKVAGR